MQELYEILIDYAIKKLNYSTRERAVKDYSFYNVSFKGTNANSSFPALVQEDSSVPYIVYIWPKSKEPLIEYYDREDLIIGPYVEVLGDQHLLDSM